jgi:hypothetical protein
MAGEATCRCGTYAIGVCQECGADVCGIHSHLVGERRECSHHAQDRAQEKSRLDEAEAAQRRSQVVDLLTDAASVDDLKAAQALGCGYRALLPATVGLLRRHGRPASHELIRVGFQMRTRNRRGTFKSSVRRVSYGPRVACWQLGIAQPAGFGSPASQSIAYLVEPDCDLIEGIGSAGFRDNYMSWAYRKGWQDTQTQLMVAAGSELRRSGNTFHECKQVRPLVDLLFDTTVDLDALFASG